MWRWILCSLRRREFRERRNEKPCGTYSERRDVILWCLSSMREIHLTFRDARFVRPLMYTSLRLGARGKSPLMRTHEPCVPTGQANFPHGLLTTPKAPLLKSLAIGLWTLSLSGKYLQCLFHSAWRYSLLTDIAPHGISVNSCPFLVQKITRRYVRIRGDFWKEKGKKRNHAGR